MITLAETKVPNHKQTPAPLGPIITYKNNNENELPVVPIFYDQQQSENGECKDQGSRPFGFIALGTHSEKVLFDSGSHISIVGRNFTERYEKNVGKVALDRDDTPRVIAVNMEEIQILGKTKLTIELISSQGNLVYENIPVYVTSEDIESILGSNFLHYIGADMNFQDKHMKITRIKNIPVRKNECSIICEQKPDVEKAACHMVLKHDISV